MATFNKTRIKTPVKNLAGGKAKPLRAKEELALLVVSNLVEDNFYRSSNDTIERLQLLCSKVPAEFIGKLAVYARKEFHVRSITHALIGELIRNGKGTPNIRKYIYEAIERPDDIAGVVSYYRAHVESEGAFPAALYHGLKQSFDKFNDYQLGKYKMSNAEWKLVDLINMIRPVPTERNKTALSAIVTTGKFGVDTWETVISKEGADKQEEWERLIMEEKLGYMAMLRNLNNFCKVGVSDEAWKKVYNFLTDESAVENSKQFPYRFFSAYKTLERSEHTVPRIAFKALSKACDLSVKNMPNLEDTAILLDTSGSMQMGHSGKSIINPIEIGALMAAVAIKYSDKSDLIIFASTGKRKNINPELPVLEIVNKILSMVGEVGHGTDMYSSFDAMNRGYKRIMIVSDMQTWARGTGTKYNNWCKKYSSDPFVYEIDVTGYGTTQFDGSKVFRFGGFSDTIFKLMEHAETDSTKLVKEVESYM